MTMREGLHVGMQCYMRQHDAFVHSTSWRDPPRRKFTKGSITHIMKWSICRWNVQKMRSESVGYMWKTTCAFVHCWRIKTTLESYLEEHAQEIWERNWINPEMHTTLLKMNDLKLMETIMKALREAGEIAGLVPEIALECEEILKE